MTKAKAAMEISTVGNLIEIDVIPATNTKLVDITINDGTKARHLLFDTEKGTVEYQEASRQIASRPDQETLTREINLTKRASTISHISATVNLPDGRSIGAMALPHAPVIVFERRELKGELHSFGPALPAFTRRSPTGETIAVDHYLYGFRDGSHSESHKNPRTGKYTPLTELERYEEDKLVWKNRTPDLELRGIFKPPSTPADASTPR